MNLARIGITIGIVALGSSFFMFERSAETTVPKPQIEVAEAQVEEPGVALSSYTVKDGDTFATILEDWGIGYETILDILGAASSTYDFTRVRVGRDLRYAAEGSNLKRLEYDMDTEEMVIVEYKNGSYSAFAQPITYETQRTLVRGSIDTSLFEAGLQAGLAEGTIVDYAEVFAWDIDFATEIQKGDEFVVLYDKRIRDGKDAPSGRIYAGKFVLSGDERYGFYFETPDGKGAYYTQEGESLVKQFLKAPLSYSRITSGYTYARFHPALGRTTPHRAIDYAAPMGTPVLATADGTVNFAAWNGGYGRFVIIHHNDTYTTRYAHLSGFGQGIRPGTRVKQGQVIGYVGSTGFSTGPHLHYEIMQNGTLVNPLTIELPAGDPISDDQREAFRRVVDEFKPELDSQSEG